MDIDKLFKAPKMALGSNKRRMPDNPTPEMLKRIRADDSTAPPPNSVNGSKKDAKGKAKAVTVMTEEEDDAQYEQDSFAPGGDADYFMEEDEEGRFFGGGLTEEQKKILNIFDDASGADGVQDSEELGITGIRKLLLRLERAINKNQDQRSKYPDDPSKFIDSEADLDGAIKALLPLSQVPGLAYPELVKSGAVTHFVGLLSHENVDIVIDIIDVIQELTDEDVGNEADEVEEGVGSNEDGLKVLIEGLLENSILELLVSNLSRLNEAEESDRQGVFNTLGIFENMIAIKPTLVRTIVTSTPILKWLLDRIKAKKHDENRGYASEIVAILLQTERENRLEFGKLDGVDNMLQLLAQYRKRDPVDADEAEFMENVFDAFCSALTEPEIKQLFLEGEGVELMLIMMKEKMLSRSRSIKLLDHALSGPAGTACCETFVEALGLKTLFSALMGKAKKQKSALATTSASEDTSHVLGIIASLFSNLESGSTARVRLLTKFAESEYEKVEKLLEIRESAEGRLATIKREISQEREAMIADSEEVGEGEEDMWYLRKLDGGLFTLQTVDYVLGWICMEDDGIRAHTQLMLGRKGKSLKDIVAVLQEYHDNVTDDAAPRRPEDAMAIDQEEKPGLGAPSAPSQKLILEGLLGFLESC